MPSPYELDFNQDTALLAFFDSKLADSDIETDERRQFELGKEVLYITLLDHVVENPQLNDDFIADLRTRPDDPLTLEDRSYIELFFEPSRGILEERKNELVEALDEAEEEVAPEAEIAPMPETDAEEDLEEERVSYNVDNSRTFRRHRYPHERRRDRMPKVTQAPPTSPEEGSGEEYDESERPRPLSEYQPGHLKRRIYDILADDDHTVAGIMKGLTGDRNYKTEDGQQVMGIMQQLSADGSFAGTIGEVRSSETYRRWGLRGIERDDQSSWRQHLPRSTTNESRSDQAPAKAAASETKKPRLVQTINFVGALVDGEDIEWTPDQAQIINGLAKLGADQAISNRNLAQKLGTTPKIINRAVREIEKIAPGVIDHIGVRGKGNHKIRILASWKKPLVEQLQSAH